MTKQETADYINSLYFEVEKWREQINKLLDELISPEEKSLARGVLIGAQLQARITEEVGRLYQNRVDLYQDLRKSEEVPF